MLTPIYHVILKLLKGFPMPSLILNKFLRIAKNLPNELFYE